MTIIALGNNPLLYEQTHKLDIIHNDDLMIFWECFIHTDDIDHELIIDLASIISLEIFIHGIEEI